MAISAIAILDTSPHSISYLVTEDGNAVDVVAHDVPADLATGPLATLLGAAIVVANQAAARTLVEANCDFSIHHRASTSAGATAGPTPFVDPNIAGGAAGNFRLDFSSNKAADADTAVYVARLTIRHSITN